MKVILLYILFNYKFLNLNKYWAIYAEDTWYGQITL